MTKNAIIFSKNENISTLIANELLLAGINVKTIVTLSDEDESAGLYDFIVIDLTSVESTYFPTVRSLLTRNVSSFKICISNGEENQHIPWGFNKYLPFPFHLEKLRQIILNPVQSEAGDIGDKDVESKKCFFADKNRRGVTLEGTYVPLSRYEFDTLELLCQNKGKCVERSRILEMLNSADSNISDVYISHLRNKLELPFGLKIIYTVRSKGYMTDYTITEYLP